MTAANFDTILAANGDYIFPWIKPGTRVALTVSGGFDSAAVTLGYAVVVAGTDTFTAYVDANGTAYTFTANGGIESVVPPSGRLAVRLASVASAATLLFSAAVIP